jgi:NAD(P)-dependent dehydrogenase (short-subunit alcohol dehydrogenase family)
MARIFITGSADGLGRMAAELLLQQGHSVVLHARNARRADDARAAVPAAEHVIVGDLSSLQAMKTVAKEANALGTFDAVIHNAALGYQEPRRITTVDGLAQLFAVNTLAPYVLTCLMERPKRLVYLSSGLHKQGDATLKDLNWETRRWDATQAYCDSKLHDTMLAFAVARLWPGTPSTSVEPGWVATKMGGKGATDDLSQGHLTQVWLAASNDAGADLTGKHFYHLAERAASPAARNVALQEQLLAACETYSGVAFPR